MLPAAIVSDSIFPPWVLLIAVPGSNSVSDPGNAVGRKHGERARSELREDQAAKGFMRGAQELAATLQSGEGEKNQER